MLFCQSMLIIPFSPVFIVTYHPFLYLSSLSLLLYFHQSSFCLPYYFYLFRIVH